MKVAVPHIPHSPGPHAHHRARLALAVVSACAGGAAVLVATFLLLGDAGPSTAPGSWSAVAVFVVIWATGVLWRSDAPDTRDPHSERERRGF